MEQTDEQKRNMEEQLRYREKQAKMMLKQLAVNKKLVERAMERIKADREVVEKVELKEEKNELRRTALKARLAEMDAVLEGERLKLEMVDLNKEIAEQQLEEINKLLSK